ncbi:MAG: hypothetical protein RR135_04255, partial [Oscillospiraceae bacterium]
MIDGMTDPSFCADDYTTLSSMQLLKTVRTVPKGCEPESLTCILTLLGVSVIPPFLRGYAEALGAGISVQKNDLILRASWFSVVNGRCNLPIEAPAHLRADLGAAYYHLGGNKSLLLLPNMATCVESICTCPFYSRTGETVKSLRPSGNVLVERLFDENCAEDRCML